MCAVRFVESFWSGCTVCVPLLAFYSLLVLIVTNSDQQSDIGWESLWEIKLKCKFNEIARRDLIGIEGGGRHFALHIIRRNF